MSHRAEFQKFLDTQREQETVIIGHIRQIVKNLMEERNNLQHQWEAAQIEIEKLHGKMVLMQEQYCMQIGWLFFCSIHLRNILNVC